MISDPFMLRVYVLFQVSLISGSIFTLITGISNTFMFGLFVSIQATLYSGRIFTLITRKSDPFMFRFFVLFQLTLCRSSIFTLITGISDPFMLRFFCDFSSYPVCWQHIHTDHRDILYLPLFYSLHHHLFSSFCLLMYLPC